MKKDFNWKLHLSNFLAAVVIVIAAWAYLFGHDHVSWFGYLIGGTAGLLAIALRVVTPIQAWPILEQKPEEKKEPVYLGPNP